MIVWSLKNERAPVRVRSPSLAQHPHHSETAKTARSLEWRVNGKHFDNGVEPLVRCWRFHRRMDIPYATLRNDFVLRSRGIARQAHVERRSEPYGDPRDPMGVCCPENWLALRFLYKYRVEHDGASIASDEIACPRALAGALGTDENVQRGRRRSGSERGIESFVRLLPRPDVQLRRYHTTGIGLQEVIRVDVYPWHRS